MKQITKDLLLLAAPVTHQTRAVLVAEYLNKWAEKFGVNTDLRMAHFLAQAWHESACLRRIEEDLCYSEKGLLRTFPQYFNAAIAKQYARKPDKIANRVYANRMGNGSEASGDGYRFRGRGLLQLTGRENYHAYADSKYCQGDLMAHPDWLAQFPGAVKSALWYWQKRGLNALADRDDILTVTRRINGGQNGLEEREYLTMKFKGALGL